LNTYPDREGIETAHQSQQGQHMPVEYLPRPRGD